MNQALPEGLHHLHEGGVRLVTLTNGAAAMSDGALSRAGVLDLFEARLSVTDAGRWKPLRP
jgi:2-haloacid dehalogenase